MANKPYAGLVITGGADTLALTTAAAKFVSWSAAGGSLTADDSNTATGDPAVKADQANNRILVSAPGTYKLTFVLEGVTASGALTITAQLRKNAVAIAGVKQKNAFINTAKAQLILVAIFKILPSDLPQKQTPPQTGIATFADPASTEFIGAGGAPKMEVPVDIALTGSGSDTLTTEEAFFLIERIDA